MHLDWPERLGVWWIAEDHPDLVAVAASPEGTRTYGELTGQAHQVVHTLQALGVPDDAAIAVLAPNGVDLLVWSMACQEGGYYFLPLNWHLSSAEVAAVLEHSGAPVLVVHESLAPLGRTAVAASATPPTHRLVLGDAEGFTPVAELLAPHPTTAPAHRSPGAIFSYTSGTTGRPKGIRRPRPQGDPSKASHDAAILARAFEFTPLTGRNLVSAAMHHVGTHSFYIGGLNVGEALVIMERFEPEECLRLIEAHQVTTAYMVPTMFHRLLRLPEEVRHRYDLSSLHSVIHSAAPCPLATKQQMMAWWGPVLWESYGGTEGAATIAKPHRWLEKPGTVGRAVRGVTVSILDDDGNELPPGQLGLVYIEMATVPFTYHGDDDATRQAFKGRRFTLGDIGELDADGYLFIRDRAKDMIIVGGVNVYPAEVEALLMGHPAVHDVAVLGVPHEEWGEEIKAVVQPSPGVEPTTALGEELVAWCRERLAHFKCPRSVDFRAELPRTEAGKLYKRKLRDDYWAASGRQV